MRFLAALLVLALLAPPAMAQLPIPALPGSGTTSARLALDLNDPGGAMVPGRPYTYKVVAHYIYGSGGVVPPGQDSCATLQVQGLPSYATGNVTPPTICFPINPTVVTSGTTVDNSTLLDLNLTAQAPALEPFNVTVVADAAANGPIGPAHGEVSHIFQAGFVGKVMLVPSAPIVIRGGEAQDVVLHLRNLGNGPIQVSFTNISLPQNMRGTLPPPLTLPTPGMEGTAVVTVRAPWTLPGKGQIEVMMTTQYPGRKDLAGDAPHMKIDVASKAAVPGFEPLLLLSLLGAAVLARRR